MISSRRFGFFIALPMVVAVSLSACSDEGDEVEGGKGGTKAGSAGKGGSDSKAGSSNEGGKAGSSTAGSSAGGDDEPNAGTSNNGGTQSTAGTSSTGEGGMAGEMGMAGEGGTTPNGGTGGTTAGTGGGGTGGTTAGTGGGGTGGTTAGTGGGDEGGSGGEGGSVVPTCPPMPVLNAFGAAADITGWSGGVFKSDFSGMSGTSTVTWSSTEGHTAAGALQDAIAFAADGPNGQTTITLDPRVDWSCYTKLHMWIKVVAADPADYAKLDSIQTYFNPGATYDFIGGGGWTNNFSAEPDGFQNKWREFVLTLDAAKKGDIGRIGVMFQAKAAVNVTMYIDDISLE